MAAQGQDPNQNRIDVSLSIMSDAALQAVKNLTDSVSGLRDLITASGLADPQAATAAQGRAAGSVSPGGMQAGIYHGLTQQPQQGNTDLSNPSQGAQRSREERDRLRREYEEYMESVKNQGQPTALSGDAQSMMMHNLSDIQRMRLAVGEKRNPNVPVTSAVDRFFELYPGVSRDPLEDRTLEDVSQVPRSGGSALPEGVQRVQGGAQYGGFTGVPVAAGSPGDPMDPVPGGGWQYGPGGLVIPQGSGGGGRRPPNNPPTATGGADFGGNTDGGGPNQPGWEQALGREGITPESRLGLTIPRLGEFTIQDKLNMYAQWVGRAAMRRQDAGDTGTGTNAMGRTAAGAAYLRDQSAGIVAIGREFQRLRNYARGEELTGEQLGFSRESMFGDVELGGVGFRINTGFSSAAQREAIHQQLTQRRVQAAPGVSGEEAQRIRNLVGGMGYSGDLNANLQLNMFRNLQQRGIAPEAVAPLIDQGVRQGNSSIAALRDIMYDLADAARHAHMTLDEVASSTAEYAESVQSLGANYEDALRNAAVYTRMGVDPRLMSQAQQSPMVQGVLTARTGLPPQLQGILGAPQVAQGVGTAIEQGLAMGAPFANLPDQTITTASGERLTMSTGRDAQVAMAAQVTGLPRQLIERYQRNPQFLQAGATAATMAQRMQEQVQALTHRSREIPVYEEHGPHNEVTVIGPSGLERRDITPRGKRIGTKIEDVHRNLSDADRRRLDTGRVGDGIVSYKELEAQMIAMDPTNEDWKTRVRKISRDHGNVEDRIKVASRIIGEATETKPEPDYLVGLTDEARKILKIEKPKDRNAALPRANAGGTPANSGTIGPGFPSSTGGAMSYGRPGP